MSNITDELSREELNKLTSAVPKAAEKSVQGIKKGIQGVKKGIEGGVKAAKAAVKGVCLIIKGGKFTTDAVMKAVTADVKYSHQNVQISKLMQSDTVKKIDAAQTAEVMKYFDKYCKKCGVKYSAMKDNKDPTNPVYMVFYEGKQAAVIDYVFKQASADYLKDQSKLKDKQAEKAPKRESVRAKLAFFRSRTESEGQDVKNHQHEHQKERADRQAR